MYPKSNLPKTSESVVAQIFIEPASMTPIELKAYFAAWRQNRLDKLAPQVIQEFRQHPERYDSLHFLATTKTEYPYQEYASWLSGHVIEEFYNKQGEEKIQEVIDAYLDSSNQSVKRNLLKIIKAVHTDYRSGELLERAFLILAAPDEAIALRSYSFHYLLDLLKIYPELATEIDAIIEQKPELFTSGAMRSCLKRYAKFKEISS